MSTCVDAADPCRLKQTIDDVRSDLGGFDRRAWILIGHVHNNNNLIDVVSADTSAQASLEDFRSKLEDDQVMYGLLRVISTVDMSPTVRFIYVHWIGERVPYTRRGRFGVVHGSVKANFQPWHVQIDTSTTEDLGDEELLKQVEEGCMTRSRIIETCDLEGRQERGYTTHSMPRSISGTLVTSDPRPPRIPSAPPGGPVPAAEQLTEAIGEVRDDKSPITWVVAGFEDGDLKKRLIMVAKGQGDLEDMKGVLQDDKIMYAFYRNVDAMDDIPTVKFVYIYWMGQGVKLLMKGKVSAFLGPVEEHFSPVHASMSVSSLEEITPAGIGDKVRTEHVLYNFPEGISACSSPHQVVQPRPAAFSSTLVLSTDGSLNRFHQLFTSGEAILKLSNISTKCFTSLSTFLPGIT